MKKWIFRIALAVSSQSYEFGGSISPSYLSYLWRIKLLWLPKIHLWRSFLWTFVQKSSAYGQLRLGLRVTRFEEFSFSLTVVSKTSEQFKYIHNVLLSLNQTDSMSVSSSSSSFFSSNTSPSQSSSSLSSSSLFGDDEYFSCVIFPNSETARLSNQKGKYLSQNWPFLGQKPIFLEREQNFRYSHIRHPTRHLVPIAFGQA